MTKEEAKKAIARNRASGGPAFPAACTGTVIPGMTLRQFYKGMALAGMKANGDYTMTSFQGLAYWAGALADAMLCEDEEASK
jgi:hypothetical protein